MKEKVIEIMKEVLETEDISLNTSQENCENWNSLRHLNLVSELEEAFNMEFEPEEIADIKRRVHPQPKMCYENAWKLCDRFEYEGNHKIEYCEGYLNMRGFPIDHAFNKVDDKYVDITIELALNRNVVEEGDTYVTLGIYNTDEVRKILLQNGFYGDIYNTIFLNKYKENVK
jgi:acyl carrier protein